MKNVMLKASVWSVLTAGVLVSLLAGYASAQTTTIPDPTNGQYEAGVGGVESWIKDVGAGPLFALVVTVLLITVGLIWLKRARSKAT